MNSTCDKKHGRAYLKWDDTDDSDIIHGGKPLGSICAVAWAQLTKEEQTAVMELAIKYQYGVDIT